MLILRKKSCIFVVVMLLWTWWWGLIWHEFDPNRKNMTQETKWIPTWGGLPNTVCNLFKGGTNGANFLVALFALNLALFMCAKRFFAKEATPKSPLHFQALQWQLPPYYWLTYFWDLRRPWLDHERIEKTCCYLLRISKGTWRFGTWFWSWFTWWWKHAWKKKNFREVSCCISNGWMSDVHPWLGLKVVR